MNKSLDVICLGRAAVDLYGDQIGGRLEDMQSYAKYLGGSSGNLAAGLARLGTKSSMLTRVGNEHMGRFVIEALQREGVDVSLSTTLECGPGAQPIPMSTTSLTAGAVNADKRLDLTQKSFRERR